MSDVIINAKVGISGVNNGAVVVFAQETGAYERYTSQINQYVAPGVLFTRLNDRFDEHYGGGPQQNVAVVNNFNAVIASGQTISSAVDFRDTQIAGIYFPSGFSGSTINFLSSVYIDGDYQPINQVDRSSLYSLPVSSGYQPVDLPVFAGVRFLKIQSSSAQNSEKNLSLSSIAL